MPPLPAFLPTSPATVPIHPGQQAGSGKKRILRQMYALNDRSGKEVDDEMDTNDAREVLRQRKLSLSVVLADFPDNSRTMRWTRMMSEKSRGKAASSISSSSTLPMHFLCSRQEKKSAVRNSEEDIQYYRTTSVPAGPIACEGDTTT